MKKTAFKTFVCSFVFSLFAILLTNRAYLRTPKTDNNDIKISGKNITLFLKSDDLAPISLASLPTKKIVLSTVADIAKEERTQIDNITPSSQDVISEDIAENHFENTDTSELPVQVLKKEEIPVQPASKVLADTDITPSTQQASTEQTLALNQQVATLTSSSKNISDEENTLIDIKIPLEQSDTKKIAAFEPKADKPAEKNINKEVNKEADKPAKEIKTAQADTPSILPEEKEPQILIPLENSQKQIWAKAEIKTAAEANKNQVALNSKNIPISSMDTEAHGISATTSKTKDKAWKSMKEKYGSKKDDDDPWVVAKGKKFPDNQLLLDDKKYKISDDEVQKIFEANEKLSSNSEAENIQLASKTVKNLLIPIPEDILNDENLTPQLISSPKNKEIKEELEAKGLIRKEEESKEEPKEVTPVPSTSETTNTGATAKDGSILDSLTSLFAGNKTATPEIGINEDEEEDTNTLFSAFTRKQNRLMSKILPTEIRLSFQPNRAEISGQTLKWIKAFAQKTAEEPTTGLEIRIDGTSSPLLQRRRLNLLQNILLNEGAAPEKINTIFTAREPNSFILRTVRINKETINTPAKNNNRYMQW